MNYEFLIFDLDGTLIDSQGDVGHALNRVLADYDVPAVSADEVRSHVGYGIQPVIIEKLGQKGIADCAPAFKMFADYYLGRCAEDTVLFAGVAELLSRLSSRRKVILTNKSTKFVGKILTGLGIKDHFLAHYGRESFVRTKPDPLPIESILKEHGVAKDRALMIGDTETDVNAGLGAGVATCLFTGGYGRPAALDALRPTHRIARMADLARLLGVDAVSL